jgi:replication factor C subunit 2/4
MNNYSLFNTKSTKISKNIEIKLPWVEKYRPKNSNDIILDPFIKQKIDKILETKSIPNLIITGEPGTGKTSTIICLAKQIYNEEEIKENVLELNASDDRGLSIINNTILPFFKKKTKNNAIKLVILDEADSITNKAQNLLANIIAEYRKNTRFVFICNDCSQITESIQSRCMIIKYSKLNKDDLFNKIKYICENEGMQHTDKGIEQLLFLSDYDIRQSINNLECMYHSDLDFNEDNIFKILDKPKPYYMNLILTHCFKDNLDEVIKIVYELYNKGYTPNDILLTFMKYLMENNDSIELDHEYILKIYEIISLSYIRVNGGIDTLLQLCGCISKIFLYLK